MACRERWSCGFHGLESGELRADLLVEVMASERQSGFVDQLSTVELVIRESRGAQKAPS